MNKGNSSSMKKVTSQQRSTDTFRLAEAQTPTIPGQMIEIAPVTTLYPLGQRDIKIGNNNVNLYMLIDQANSNTQSQSIPHSLNMRSSPEISVKISPENKSIKDNDELLIGPTSPEGLHYADSDTKLQPRSLDEKSAGSSSDQQVHQLLLPLSLTMTHFTKG